MDRAEVYTFFCGNGNANCT